MDIGSPKRVWLTVTVSSADRIVVDRMFEGDDGFGRAQERQRELQRDLSKVVLVIEAHGWTRPERHWELAAEYEAWANGQRSEISDEAMCFGSEKYRQEHPEICG